MGRTANRTPEQTRAALLDAAAELVTSHGLALPLATIATHAGVSKGGLLYHFATKDDLLLALARSFLDRFEELFQSHLDAAASAPHARAYVLASTAEEVEETERLALFGQLTALPAVAEFAQADEDKWRARIAADGLPDALALLVITACDGLGAAALWGVPRTVEERLLLRATLLDLLDSHDA